MTKTIDWGKGAEFSGPQHYFRESLIVSTVIKHLKKGAVILDLGAGSGSLAFRLAEAGYRINGTDVNKNAVNKFSEEIMKKGMERDIKANFADGADLPFKNGFFDGVTAGEVLEHIEDDRKVLAEIARVLKKDGCLFVTVPARPDTFGEIDRLAGHQRRYTKEELKEKTVKADLVIKYIFDWGFPITNIWQKYILVRAVKKIQMKSSEGGPLRGMLNQKWLHKILSVFFWPDVIIRNTGLGYCLFMVAEKK